MDYEVLLPFIQGFYLDARAPGCICRVRQFFGWLAVRSAGPRAKTLSRAPDVPDAELREECN
jgi:hypothetical protein